MTDHRIQAHESITYVQDRLRLEKSVFLKLCSNKAKTKVTSKRLRLSLENRRIDALVRARHHDIGVSKLDLVAFLNIVTI